MKKIKQTYKNFIHKFDIDGYPVADRILATIPLTASIVYTMFHNSNDEFNSQITSNLSSLFTKQYSGWACPTSILLYAVGQYGLYHLDQIKKHCTTNVSKSIVNNTSILLKLFSESLPSSVLSMMLPEKGYLSSVIVNNILPDTIEFISSDIQHKLTDHKYQKETTGRVIADIAAGFSGQYLSKMIYDESDADAVSLQQACNKLLGIEILPIVIFSVVKKLLVGPTYNTKDIIIDIYKGSAQSIVSGSSVPEVINRSLHLEFLNNTVLQNVFSRILIDSLFEVAEGSIDALKYSDQLFHGVNLPDSILSTTTEFIIQ